MWAHSFRHVLSTSKSSDGLSDVFRFDRACWIAFFRVFHTIQSFLNNFANKYLRDTRDCDHNILRNRAAGDRLYETFDCSFWERGSVGTMLIRKSLFHRTGILECN